MSLINKYRKYRNRAESKEWIVPTEYYGGAHGMQSWIDYWKAMTQYEMNGGARPVPPHSSGGGTQVKTNMFNDWIGATT